jgi:hypothetical protein
MTDSKLRWIVCTPLAAVAAIALVFALCSLNSSSASAQGYGPTTTPMAGPMAASASGTCAAGDSWCAYCSMNPGSADCEAFVPAHVAGTTATGAEDNAHNQPVMGVDAGCMCNGAVAGTGASAFIPSSAVMNTYARYGVPSVSVAGTSVYGFTPAMYTPGLDVGGSWTWCARANLGGGAWVPSGLVGTAIC